MTFGIHALYIAHIVPLLADISRCPGRTGSRETSSQQAGTGSNSCPAPASQSGARRCAKPGAYGGASCPAGYRGLVGCRPSGLVRGKLPAGVVIVAKLIETPARARQRHHAGTGRYARAACQRGECK
jgi:hypothetical protein